MGIKCYIAILYEKIDMMGWRPIVYIKQFWHLLIDHVYRTYYTA